MRILSCSRPFDFSLLLPNFDRSTNHFRRLKENRTGTMAPAGTASQFDQAALERRVALQGQAGPMALVRNAKVFGIACFACFGGLLYGYNQGVFSGVLTMTSFGNRKCNADSIVRQILRAS